MSETSLAQILSEFTSAGLADVGDSYQELLLSGSAISPPDGLSAPENYEPSSNDPTPDLDVG